LPTDRSQTATVRAHTIFDRTLFRAGETASMKHVIRAQNMQGFSLLDSDKLPTRIRIIHQGSGQEFQFPLAWRGQKNAETVFAIPKDAKLGVYDVILDRGRVKGSDSSDDGEGRGYYGGNSFNTGSFRVEEFRLPLMQGRITPPKGVLVAPKELPLDVQLNFINGGGASGQTVRVSSLLRSRSVSFPAYDGFSFSSNESSTYDEEGNRIVSETIKNRR